MENENNENLDSKNQENTEEGQKPESDARLAELEEKNRQLFERAKKAENEAKEFRGKVKELTTERPEKPNVEDLKEPDYGRLAFLNSLDIKHPDDQKVAIDEASRLKLPLSDVLQMEHVQARMKVGRETREAQSGMISGKGRSGGASRNDVDYWVSKGGLPENDQKLAEQIVEARMSKESNNKFADQMFNE